MSVNKYKPHILILPEDDANRQLANGFILEIECSQIQVLPAAGGWLKVFNSFEFNYASSMEKYQERYMFLLIDVDDDLSRLQTPKQKIPEALAERVFIPGVNPEPEALKKLNLGSFEAIGKTMAGDCRDGTQAIWTNNHLKHNIDELTRLRQAVCSFLFLP